MTDKNKINDKDLENVSGGAGNGTQVYKWVCPCGEVHYDAFAEGLPQKFFCIYCQTEYGSGDIGISRCKSGTQV